MFFFSPFKTALMDDIVGTAVLDGFVVEAKYSNPETLIAAGSKHGVCCFFLNGNDREVHKRVLSYMLENGLIRKTKSGKLYNISFKFDSEGSVEKVGVASDPKRVGPASRNLEYG